MLRKNRNEGVLPDGGEDEVLVHGGPREDTVVAVAAKVADVVNS